MDQQHPITPPPEVEQHLVDGPGTWREKIVNAYRAGADAELEECVKWLTANGNPRWAVALQEGRRPKPPSLAEQATAKLDEAVTRGDCITTTDAMPILRRALERLQQLELENND